MNKTPPPIYPGFGKAADSTGSALSVPEMTQLLTLQLELRAARQIITLTFAHSTESSSAIFKLINLDDVEAELEVLLIATRSSGASTSNYAVINSINGMDEGAGHTLSDFWHEDPANRTIPEAMIAALKREIASLGQRYLGLDDDRPRTGDVVDLAAFRKADRAPG